MFNDQDIERVLTRDNNACCACGATGDDLQLTIAYIESIPNTGAVTTAHVQTLCDACFAHQEFRQIDFTKTETQLKQPQKLMLFPPDADEDIHWTLARIVNAFYQCRAVNYLNLPEFHGRTTWTIELHPGNDPTWLQRHADALLVYIHETLGFRHVTTIAITDVPDDTLVEYDIFDECADHLDVIRLAIDNFISFDEGFKMQQTRQYTNLIPDTWWNNPAFQAGNLFLSIDCRAGSVRLLIIIGEGDAVTRQPFLDLALAHQPPFTCSTSKLNKTSNTIYSKLLAKYIDDTPYQELLDQFMNNWGDFINDEWPSICAIFQQARWIWEEAQ